MTLPTSCTSSYYTPALPLEGHVIHIAVVQLQPVHTPLVATASPPLRTTNMPSFFRNRSSSPETAVQVDTMTPTKTVGFVPGDSPVTSVSRPLTNPEQWTLYHFESHARTCRQCLDPYAVHKAGRQLCDDGHLLAQEVARIIYSQHRGRDVYDATLRQSDYAVKVELPHDYFEVRSLLKAMERSLRHRSQKPIVSFDRTYPIMRRASNPSRRLSLQDSPVSETRAATVRHASPQKSSLSTKSSRRSSPSPKRERRKSQALDGATVLLTFDTRTGPSSWKSSPLSKEVEPTITLTESTPTLPRNSISSQPRPVTPENRRSSSSGRDLLSAPTKPRSTRPRSSRSNTSNSTSTMASSPSKSDESVTHSPSRTKAARAAALAMLEASSSLPSPPSTSSRPTTRDGPVEGTPSNPFAVVPNPASLSKTTRRRSKVVADDSNDDRRASTYDGASFKTEVREPRSRRWSTSYN